MSQSIYDRASSGSKAKVDALEDALRFRMPSIFREHGKFITVFGAPGFIKFAFLYPSIRGTTVRIFFTGRLEAEPPPIDGMPSLLKRGQFSNSRTLSTPYFVVIDDMNQVAPFAEFLINYSVPLSKAKRGSKSEFTLPGELPDLEYLEGHVTRVTVNRYERDPKAREACIRKHGSSCQCCGMNFKDTYGDKSDGFIHVHHIVQISKRNTNYKVNPETDLVPLCPNCHAVAHRSDPPLSLEDLKATYKH